MFFDGAIPELPEDEEDRRELWYEHNPEHSYPCGRLYERDRPAALHSSTTDNLQAELDDLETRCVDLKEISEQQYRWSRHNLLQKARRITPCARGSSNREVESSCPAGYFGASRLWMSFFEDIDLGLDFETGGRFCDLAPQHFAKAWRKIESRFRGTKLLKGNKRIVSRISNLAWLYETWHPLFMQESLKYESGIPSGGRNEGFGLDHVEAIIAEMDIPQTHAMKAILTRVFALSFRDKGQSGMEEKMWAQCQEHLVRAADEQFSEWITEDKERDAKEAEITKAQERCRELRDKINRHQDVEISGDSGTFAISDGKVPINGGDAIGNVQSTFMTGLAKNGSIPREHGKENSEGSKKRTAKAAGLEEPTEEQFNPKRQKASRKRDDLTKSRPVGREELPGQKKKRPREEYEDNENEIGTSNARPRKRTKRALR